MVVAGTTSSVRSNSGGPMPADERRTPRVVASGKSRTSTLRSPTPRTPRRPSSSSVVTKAPSAGRKDALPPEPPSRRRRGFLRRHAKGIALSLVLPPLILVSAVLWYARSIPLPPDELSAQTTFIYDANGVVLASLNAGQDRTAVPLSRVPKLTVDAILASEDHNFYQHGGVDPVGVGRALWADVRSRGSLQGGSTITQQYVKVTYLGRERTFNRKLREAILSVKLERRLTKDQILERYLNVVYFGRGAYGVQAAAQAYFGVDVDKLDLAESAYLAGLLRAPERADARRNPVLALARRQRVLDSMVRFELITVAQRDTAVAVPLAGAGGIVRTRQGPTSTYEQRGAGAEFATDVVRRQLIERFGAARVFGGGLRVRTTLDLAKQEQARATLYDDVLNRPGDPDAAMVVLDHEGRVLAMIGGRDWTKSQVNLAVGRGFGGIGRQGGSTFKPFVLAAAIREGVAASSTFDAPKQISIPGANADGTDWNVGNYNDESFGAKIDLTRATALSVNTVFAQLVTDPRVGAKRVVTMAKDLGITSPLDAYPAIALGAEEVAPLEMADAYLTFAREGMRVEPTLITEVRDAGGQVLLAYKQQRQQVLTEDQAAQINAVLQQVVSHGTGVGAQLSDGRQVAGKTGTTQSSRDAWFVGYTPQDCCVVAIWMGYADSNRPMTKVHGRKVTGGLFPAQVFQKFMEASVVKAGVKTGAFRPPQVGDGGGESTLPRRSGAKGPKATPASPSDTAVQVNRPPVTGVDGGSTGAIGGGNPVSGSSSPVDSAPAPVGVQAPPNEVVDSAPPKQSPASG